MDAVNRLISILEYQANRNTEHAYLLHQRKVYHNVPMWVLVNHPHVWTRFQNYIHYFLSIFKVTSVKNFPK